MLKAEQDDSVVWRANPSHATNFGLYIGMGLLFWLVIPLFIILWKWLEIDNTEYALSNERLTLKSGVINRSVDEMELYRVRDYRIEQPFLFRLFGVSNIILDTSDMSHPVVLLQGVRNADALLAGIRQHVEKCRIKKGVRMLDME